MAKWMRAALLATGALNMLGAALFLPPFPFLRDLNHLPADSHPFYLWIISSWIFLFGLCYLWLGISGRNERLFLVIGAAGKFAFVSLLFAFAVTGEIPISTAVNGIADLVFAAIFVIYLWTTRNGQGETG